MTEQEYISSGAIEACVMGLANEEDWLELEQMAAMYPLVKEAKEKIELELEHQHLTQSLNPPSFLKQKIMQSLDFAEKEEAPVVAITDVPAANAKPLVVPIVPVPKSVKWLQRVVAASVILLMGSILLNFHFYSKSVGYKKDYNALVLQQNSLLTQKRAMEASFNTIKDPGMKPVKMEGTPSQPKCLATVYWDTRSKDVYLMINNLPAPVEGKQYQLWALVDGKPVDAGMVEIDPENHPILKMHNMPNAQAFAITLEKKGGSAAPTMDAMYVYGAI